MEEVREENQLCGNCKHFKRCQSLINVKLIDRFCDFNPSRYVYSSEMFGEGRAGDAFRFDGKELPDPPEAK